MLNPILYTEKIISDFLKYQITAYPFADSNLYEQMRRLLNLEHTRNTPLFQGPYISLSRSFRQGTSIEQLISEKIFHPHLKQLIPHPNLYGHQEQAIRAIIQGKHTLVSTGTGSGKTECFLYPIISHCLNLKDNNAPEGITAIIVYPMNALAEDQLGRLRSLLAGTGISFGMYVGKTPERKADVTGKRLNSGASKLDYKKALQKAQNQRQPHTVYPPEERPSREEQRYSPPRILLTNVKQLELLLTRQRDVELFKNVQLQYLVFDEAHTFSGTAGAETACLIRRLKAYCQQQAIGNREEAIGKRISPTPNSQFPTPDSRREDIICIATSATITDPDQGKEAGRDFATRFFGIPRDNVELVVEQYQGDRWSSEKTLPPLLPGDPHEHLKNVLEVLEEANQPQNQGESGGKQVRVLVKAMTGRAISSQNWQESLYDYLSANELVYQLNQALRTPRLLKELIEDLKRRIERPISEAEILVWLALGAASRKEDRPLLRPVLHGFIRGVGGAVVTFPHILPNQQKLATNAREKPKLWLSAEDTTGTDNDGLYRLPVTTCTNCGQHYFIHHVADFRFRDKQTTPEGGQACGTRIMWRPLGEELGGSRVLLLDRRIIDKRTGTAFPAGFTPTANANRSLSGDSDPLVGGGNEQSTNSVSDQQAELLPVAYCLLPLPQGVDDDDDLLSDHPNTLTLVYFCRHCGTLHSSPLQRGIPPSSTPALSTGDRCDGCGSLGELIPLYAVRQRSNHPGKLTACVTCQSSGRLGVGGYREPIREVRAVSVSDVHVLAQNMIHHAERRRLLVFADNRQDAAFQAGWMQDHARRYRMRSLMYDRIQQASISIGDLTAHLDDLLNQDDDLSQSLIPEVWRVHRKEAEGVKHNEERKRFLRMQILREVTTGVKQRIGLEPWGRLRFEYGGLSADLDFIQRWSALIGIQPEALVNGIAALLDVTRRNSILLDREGHIFSKFWSEGDAEIQRGYLSILQGVPRGLKLQRDNSDDTNRVQQWLSQKGQTVAMQSAQGWGVQPELVADFLSELWEFLTEDRHLLVSVTLTGKRNRPLNGCTGVYQIDADKLRLTAHQGVYRCQVCRRIHLRPTPNMTCMAYRCTGAIAFEAENSDDYDLMVLDQQFSMIRAREHSAQVPAKDREVIETMFKGNNEQVNTLVCTPTLEMGVDIGSLDAVLMRNVPPLPANYWQRVGRAGRQHRMAVNLTYCRQASHDRAYFKDPLKLLQGIITPPRFNLNNPVMLQKHVHATILTVLHQLSKSSSLSELERQEIQEILAHCFPNQVKSYLFDAQGYVLEKPLDVTSFQTLIERHQAVIQTYLYTVFHQDDNFKNTINDEQLSSLITNAASQLTTVIQRLWKRLQWAMGQMKRLEGVRQQKGTLEPDEDSLRQRCDRLIKKLKGIQTRRKREAEGYDDTITYSVLACEGFLPGYGLETGSILGTAQFNRYSGGFSDFELPRPPAMALREYIPGNLIYANSNRFIPRYYHLEPEQQITLFQVDIANEAISEIGSPTNGINGGLGLNSLRAIPLCDVDLPHQSHITDEENYRFQLPVSVMGYEQQRHNGGKAYQWGSKTLLFRKGLHLRLVNVGVANRVNQGLLGYPICNVCGQSRSPLSSELELENFNQAHSERCAHNAVRQTGFFTDIIAESLTLQNCSNREEAYSVLEALRFGASRILDMELDDLQILCLGQSGQETVDVLLYDPMPGGSGLLEQILEQWENITSQALATTAQCPSVCEIACIDCLFTYRNSFYHRYLNRHLAQEKISQWGHQLAFIYDIPPKLPQTESINQAQPVNNAESLLKTMLLKAGFPQPIAQYFIDLGLPLGTTTPDFFYDDPDGRSDGICIYLDGMSKHLHGNPERQQRDHAIRDELENLGYEVIVIPANGLSDHTVMTKHFYRLGRTLLGRDQAQNLRNDLNWFHKTLTPQIE